MEVSRSPSPIEAVEVIAVDDGMRQLAGAIGPEVAVDDHVAVADRAVRLADDRRAHELVALASCIRLGHGQACVGRTQPTPLDDGVEGEFRALPAPVAIHAVVAAADGGDAGPRMHRVQASLQIGQERGAGMRRRVATVGQRVDGDVGHASLTGHLGHAHEMAIVGMDAARTDQAHQVQAPLHIGGAPYGREQHRVAREGTIGHGGVDTGQLLQDDSTGAQVEVAHLAVAHLAGRQADRLTRGVKRGVRPAAQQCPPSRHLRRRDSVYLRIATQAESVEHDDDDGTWSAGAQEEVPAPARARAVSAARATIPAISSTFRLAPPTRAPSRDGSARNSAMAALVTLPP